MTTPSVCEAWAGVENLPTSVVGLHSPQQWCGYLELATDILWAATGRRWRNTVLTGEAVLRAEPPRAGESGRAYHSSWGHCPCTTTSGLRGFAHHEPRSVRLPHPDVVEVTSVLIDGAPFTGWRLDGSWLARIDGRGWPECHDRTVVTYRFGRVPPPTGAAMCVELAVELGKATADEDAGVSCSLPQRTRTVTRQGLTFDMIDPQEFLEDGLTGLYSVDLWITSVNPYRRKQSATVWSPDLARARRTA